MTDLGTLLEKAGPAAPVATNVVHADLSADTAPCGATGRGPWAPAAGSPPGSRSALSRVASGTGLVAYAAAQPKG